VRILIAEDEPISRRLLAKALEKMGHDVVSTPNGSEAWAVLQGEDIRLVIADWEMPEMDGIELVRRVRTETPDRYVYFILLTSRVQRKDIVRGMDAGADDYVTKPFDSEELRVRIRAGERVTRLEEELELKNDQLRLMAMVDGLTGISNRRAFDEEFPRVREASRRFQRQFSVVMIDIDRFKSYNDSLGHEAGDGALRAVAQILSGELRHSDKVFRYGGEEFVCLLADTNEQGATQVGERLRKAIESAEIRHPSNSPVPIVTISAGTATYDPSRGETADTIIGQADQALYAAKADGRNCVVGWSVCHSQTQTT
jgi:diguanylate cyclase (GGDEF)-like protein